MTTDEFLQQRKIGNDRYLKTKDLNIKIQVNVLYIAVFNIAFDADGAVLYYCI